MSSEPPHNWTEEEVDDLERAWAALPTGESQEVLAAAYERWQQAKREYNTQVEELLRPRRPRPSAGPSAQLFFTAKSHPRPGETAQIQSFGWMRDVRPVYRGLAEPPGFEAGPTYDHITVRTRLSDGRMVDIYAVVKDVEEVPDAFPVVRGPTRRTVAPADTAASDPLAEVHAAFAAVEDAEENAKRVLNTAKALEGES